MAVPLLDWSWFSGMEVALFGAALGRALVAVRRVERAPPARRRSAALRAGLWCPEEPRRAPGAALDSALSGGALAWIVPLLGLAAALDRRARRLAAPLLLGAAGSLLRVSLNATARYQNLRYAAPALAMLLAPRLLG